MPPPVPFPPIGLRLTQTARAVGRGFDRAMTEAGGSAPVWQVLLLVRRGEWRTQSQMAGAMNVTAATLTHHLNALEAEGLVRRWREPDNRRAQHVELTDAGKALFERLRAAATKHDARLRSKLSETELAQLAELLDKLADGVD